MNAIKLCRFTSDAPTLRAMDGANRAIAEVPGMLPTWMLLELASGDRTIAEVTETAGTYYYPNGEVLIMVTVPLVQRDDVPTLEKVFATLP